jgi:hypothetical protein
VTKTTSISIEECAAAVSSIFDSIFERIDLWRLAVEHHAAVLDGRLTRKGIDELIEDIVIPEFARENSSVIGAGFVAAPGAIVDADWHLAWWLGDMNTFGMGSTAPHIRRLEAVEDPSAESFRDYTALEWWRVPARSQRRHITGPYVDYLCTDEYTLTLTEPVLFREQLIGVVGADLYAEDLERALLPELRAAAGSAVTLVNPSGRVLLSTDVHLATGSLLRFDGLATALRGSAARSTRLPGGQVVVPCADTCLSLVVG